MKNNNRPAVLFQTAYALLGWFAVILQYFLMLNNGLASPGMSTVNFFCYFTILSNIIAALCFTGLLFRPSSFFAKPQLLTAATVYMIVVGLTYNTILRPLWSPQGWDRVADELLHLVLPLMILIYWMIFVPKKDLRWKDILPGLIYPAVYCIVILIRGAFTKWYPYPFLDAAKLSSLKLFVNITGMICLFLIVYTLVTLAAVKLTDRTAKEIAEP